MQIKDVTFMLRTNCHYYMFFSQTLHWNHVNIGQYTCKSHTPKKKCPLYTSEQMQNVQLKKCRANSALLLIETDPKKTGQGQKLTAEKKSTIFELSSWNLAKRTTSVVHHFDEVSWW